MKNKQNRGKTGVNRQNKGTIIKYVTKTCTDIFGIKPFILTGNETNFLLIFGFFLFTE